MEEHRLTLNQLMLLSMLFDKKRKIADLADELSITKQGVMYHIRYLKSKGFIDDRENITPLGFEALHSGFFDLRNYISENMNRIDQAMTWEAISDSNFRQGEKAYLEMKKGYLHASKDRSETASGTALKDCKKGDLLFVGDISGLVNMSIGSIIFTVITDEALKSGNKNDDVMGKREDLVGVIGEGASAYCNNNQKHVDIEFGALGAAFDACTRGLNIRVFVSERRFRFMLNQLDEMSRTFPLVKYTIEYV